MAHQKHNIEFTAIIYHCQLGKSFTVREHL